MSRSWRLKTVAALAAAAILAIGGMAARSIQQGDEEGESARGWSKPVPVSARLIAVEIEVGREDASPENWTGEVAVSQGTVRDVEIVEGGGGNAVTKGERFMLRTRNPQAKKKKKGDEAAPAVLRAQIDAPADATLIIRTNKGSVEASIDELSNRPTTGLDGQVTIRLTPASVRLTRSETEDGYPSIARSADGAIWMTYVEYHPERFRLTDQPKRDDFDEVLIPTNNGDRIRLARFADGAWQPPIDVTDGLRDVWRPAVAVDGEGNVVVAWAEQRDDNWDIYRRTYRPADSEWSETVRVTEAPGSDFHVDAATDSDGVVWLAWQAWRDDNFDILATSVAPGRDRGEVRTVSDSDANDWTPAIAADGNGRVHVAWDSYDSGNYDVLLREITAPDASVVTVADSARFEAKADLACDDRGRVWVAYEQGDEQWGKDYSTLQYERIPFEENPGFALYVNRTVAVRCVENGAVLEPEADLQSSFGSLSDRRRSMPRLAIDDAGGLWLWFRHHPLPGGRGEVWVSSAMRFEGDGWSEPRSIADSSGLLDNRPALIGSASGLLAVYSSDNRERTANRDQADLYTTMLSSDGQVGDVSLTDVGPNPEPTVEPVHPNEDEDIARIRDYRIDHNGRSLRLLRGEFHRHTEITSHRDQDGTLEDSWRYAHDAGDLDWMGNGDHHNGFGYEYMWWYVQKVTDLMHHAPAFVAAQTYERSAVYPNGHRNVILPRRGIRPLPFGDLSGTPRQGTPDTKVLYDYLHHFGGICAVHTSATNMGTDWRDNDPEVEPIVEIYQGHRHNYERFGAPRAPTAETQIGGYQPAGFVSNALARGYRLGFQSSSDHVSTHWSYAVVLTDDPSRQGIIDAFKKRHSYAATDNIILDVRSGDHLMGDEFQTSDRPTIQIVAHGTTPIETVHVVRDNHYVFTTEPGEPTVDLTFTDDDEDLRHGVHYYYVRVEQADGNLAWASPMWIHYEPGQGDTP